MSVKWEHFLETSLSNFLRKNHSGNFKTNKEINIGCRTSDVRSLKNGLTGLKNGAEIRFLFLKSHFK